jgi:integrase
MNMASLTKDNRLLFRAADGKRKTIRLGGIPRKQAAGIQRHVEILAAAQIDGSAPPPATSQWIRGLSDGLRDKLQRVGLVAPAVATPDVLTLGQLVAEFKSRPRWHEKKPGTQLFQEKGFRYLLEHFGDGLPIDRLTDAAAEDYHAYLQLPKDKSGKGLAMSTGNRQCAVAWSLYRYAIRARYVDRNPFEDTPRGMPRTDSNVFVSAADCEKVLAELPDSQWKLLFGLARWGGLRIPSEPRRLTWADVDWERERFLVHCSKTEGHAGHETRMVPMFPELSPLFDQRFSEAADGDELVLPIMKGLTDATFAHYVRRAVKRAGVDQWPRMFHSLRSSRQTDLEREHPSHVVCAWLGNSATVARKHYLQVTDDDFGRAARNAAQQVSATGGTERKTEKVSNSESA